ncbi:transcription antitermination protein NusB [Mesomycoplasma hyorhinis]|nr:transcription antitermination protein NusB [Mesomycoplasma hyorhinis]AFX74270.1 Transcription termination protein NusB [Mesomycoplasma hyorhinis SK76]UVT32602.1 transcription antitermination protein NusB [Mesomycoplasma hyorhinis]UVT33270.1 transcription antitermination protein NusB [Mesomycoplasma hyorhinis]UVT33942.1 transcription antitermination protein NusB [Mesomycoplasma hyorhinis]
MEIISLLYSYELFDNKINTNEIFKNYDLTKEQIKILEAIEKKYEIFQKLIINFLGSNWSWNRILPLVRAILLLGSFELLVNDNKVVINEMVQMIKDYTLESDKEYKFVNAVLDKINQFYEQENLKVYKKTTQEH